MYTFFLLLYFVIETEIVEKIANYEKKENYGNMQNALKHYAVEICTSEVEVCNDMKHAIFDFRLNKMLEDGEKDMDS